MERTLARDCPAGRWYSCGAPIIHLSGVMFSVLAALILQRGNAFADRSDLLLRNAALRQQLAIDQRQGNPSRLTSADRLLTSPPRNRGGVGILVATPASGETT
jgi:hypothetical protein